MRKVLPFILFLFVSQFIVSCFTGDTDARLLRIADSLMSSSPDSALATLRKISDPVSMKRSEQAEYALLWMQASYKKHTPLNKGDSLIFLAVDYFKNSPDKVRAACAYFYLGCIYEEMKRPVLAIDAFLTADRVYPRNNQGELPAMIYEHLAKCYEDQCIYKVAKAMYRKSYEATIALGDFVNVTGPLCGIAHMSLLEGLADSALDYYDKALVVARTQNDSLQLSAVLCGISQVYRKQGKTGKALRSISESMKYAPLHTDLSPNYYLKGSLYWETGQVDSALYYLSLGKCSSGLAVRAASYSVLHNVEKELGHFEQAVLYSDSSVYWNDSIQSLIRRNEIDRLMDNHVLKLQEKRLSTDYRKRILLLTIVFTFLVSAGILLFLLADRYRKEKSISFWKVLQNLYDTIRIVEEPELHPEEPVEEEEQEPEALSDRKLKLCIELFNKTYDVSRLEAIENSANQTDKFFTPIEKDELYTAIHRSFLGVIRELKKQCNGMTLDNQIYCILSLLGYSAYTIQVCIATNPNALKTRKSRLKSQMSERLFNRIFSTVAEE